jgi:hypothetical protein
MGYLRGDFPCHADDPKTHCRCRQSPIAALVGRPLFASVSENE